MFNVKLAAHLHAGDIGESIRFRVVDEARDVVNIVTAELRQITHDGGKTYIQIGLDAEVEYVLFHDHPIVFSPCPRYSDAVDTRVKGSE